MNSAHKIHRKPWSAMGKLVHRNNEALGCELFSAVEEQLSSVRYLVQPYGRWKLESAGDL